MVGVEIIGGGVGMDLSKSGYMNCVSAAENKLLDLFVIGSLCAMGVLICLSLAFWILKKKD